MRAATHRVLSVVLIIFLVVNSFYTRPTLASVSASPTVQPLTVCWVKHWNGTGSTEWHITNPNPVPLSSNPDTKVRYNWRVFSAFNALGSLLQSANDWDNGNPNPVNTVYSQSMVVEWYLFTNGSKGGILGNAIANANPGGLCGGSGSTVTPTASKTPTKVPSATLTANKTISPTLPPTLTSTSSKTATKLPTLTPTVPTLPPTFTFTPTASQTLTLTPTVPTATLTPTVPTLTPTFTASATMVPTVPTITPTNSPTATNTSTATFTATSSATSSNTATSTTSATPTNSPTGTLAATNTLTATATQDPLTGVTCVDWRDGNAHGWTNSPWENGVTVTWNTSGMVSTSNGTNSTPLAAVYYVLPVGGPYEVVFNTIGNGSYTLAQSTSAPVNTPLPNNQWCGLS